MKTKRKILVVDDEYDAVDYLGRMLEKQGYETLRAYNGQDGYDIIQNNKVDAVVADIAMEEMGGYELCQKLKESEKYSDIPLIICTAYPNKERIFRRLGIDDYLVKPFEFNVLFDALNRIFSQVSHSIKYKKILVQSESKQEIQSVTDHIKKFGFRIDLAIAAPENNIIEDALTVQPDIVILNAVQENGSIEQIIKSIKGYVELKDIKVIFYTDPPEANKNERIVLKQKCFKAGADEYLVSLDKRSFFNLLLEHCRMQR